MSLLGNDQAWLVAAHLPTTPALEQRPHPEELLAGKHLLRRGKDGQALKDRGTYQRLACQLRDRLTEVRCILPELDRFARKLERFAGTAS
ncbi:hypothetical protein [Nannocystis sp.]|uniref:hypothetical protein n=1 Tax=Nannocystis sp. TaxID=1962667 RepID=UPI0025DA1B9D|nr:hypothetical protein [Nannocystis sp.]MBK7829775.1 hypothetical protein [Nannocystis sp.]